MHSKTRDLLTRSWQSEANLSLLLFLLILAGFVLPSLGFEKHNLSPLRRHRVYCLIGRWGCDCLGEQKTVRTDSDGVSRGDCGAVGDVVGPNNDTLAVEGIDGAGGNSCDYSRIALAGVPLGAGNRDAASLQGAIAASLYLGYSWAHAYHIAALLNPGAFSSAGSDVSAVSGWVNYSFGMLTTVGYTGIVPLHPLAHTLGSGEALTGQLYLAVWPG
jgi:hypothetical protein